MSLLQNTALSEEQRNSLEDKLSIANDGIKNLKPRVNEYISNL